MSESESSGESDVDKATESGEEEDHDINSLDGECEGYRLIDMKILQRVIASQLICKVCKGKVSMREISRKGLASEFVFVCNRCKDNNSFNSCPMIPNRTGQKLSPVASVNR